MTVYQTLGDVIDLATEAHEEFVFPEPAVVAPILSAGTTALNYVLQGGGASVRRAHRKWVIVPAADKDTIKSYAESKAEVLYTEEDGVARTVRLMEFKAALMFEDLWQVEATLIETQPPNWVIAPVLLDQTAVATAPTVAIV